MGFYMHAACWPRPRSDTVRKRKTVTKRVCNGVDRISELSDDLLVKVLSFLPTKVAVSTTILSKRWECLWMWLPKLDFMSSTRKFLTFLDTTFPLYRAPVIESFRLSLSSTTIIKPENIKLSIVIALSRNLRELKLKILNKPYSTRVNILPRSLYNCESLVTLELRGDIFVDVPRMVCLPSLKTLKLHIYKYLDGESLGRLLSICPALEDLTVHFNMDFDEMGYRLVTVIVPSLKSLAFYIRSESCDNLVINTPSLKYLYLEDLDKFGHPCSIANMPNLEDAYVDVRYCDDISSHIRSITSVKRLKICSKTVYSSDGFVFNQLEHLKLCVCSKNSSHLLVRLLEDSPNLRVLDILEMDHYGDHYPEDSPRTVDECILSTLQAFNWSRYLERRPQESGLAIYILGKRWSPNDCNSLV